MVSILHHLLRLEPSCRLVDFGAGACKLASQLYRYLHLYILYIHRCTQLQKSTNMHFQGSTFLVWFKNFLTCNIRDIYTVWLILEQIIANLSFWSCRHLKSKTYLVSITYVRMSLSLRRNIIETWTNQGWRVEETSIVCWTKSWNVGGIHICPIIHLIIVMS